MERYLIVLIFSVCCGSKYDPIFPTNHESELVKYDKKQEYIKPETDYKDDLARIDDEYKKYVEEKNNDKGYGDKNYGQRQRSYSNEELDEIFGYTGPTANDEPENLMRPCALDDWECIRRFFAANGKCKPAYGPVPDPFYEDVATLYCMTANITVALPDLEVRGLSTAKVTEFYVNKRSGNLVLSFDLETLSASCDNTYYNYRRTARESIVLAGRASVDFGPVTFTAVIPKVPDLRLDQSDCNVFVPNATPAFFLSPSLAASPDPDVATGFASIVALEPVTVQEGIIFEGQLLPALFIQNYLCDFGLKLISL